MDRRGKNQVVKIETINIMANVNCLKSVSAVTDDEILAFDLPLKI